ncbi:protein Tob1 isoform X1 [Penaeus vannamei]|uniref:protein Tob1 isoform X1 n=2 Tax=Penaeus TaxID=133894 RepID=UPI00387F3993
MKMDMKLKRTTTHFVFLASRNSLEGAAEKADHLLYSIVCMAFGSRDGQQKQQAAPSASIPATPSREHAVSSSKHRLSCTSDNSRNVEPSDSPPKLPKMHLEIQVALNFVISYMYNKLPRRRVNIFGEELEKALKEKFEGHWYPDKPMKGSAYRCLKTGDPIDPVLEKAAREAGMEIREIKDNLPEDLAVWVDPGEVSYRIGEKGQIKVLYSEAAESATQEENLDKEVTKTFNPEAQCFKPIDNLSSSLSNVSISPKSTSPYSASSPTPPFKQREASPISAFLTKSSAPLTFTTATFAQTKFGSTKLKTSTKRANRMSPTEFSHYIKQRQMIQQQQHVQQQQQQQQQQAVAVATAGFGSQFPPSRPRSLSPNPPLEAPGVYFPGGAPAGGAYNPWGRGMFDQGFTSPSFFTDLLPPASQQGPAPKFPMYEPVNGGMMGGAAPGAASMGAGDKASGLNEGVMGVYPASQYQHLLVAN